MRVKDIPFRLFNGRSAINQRIQFFRYFKFERFVEGFTKVLLAEALVWSLCFIMFLPNNRVPRGRAEALFGDNLLSAATRNPNTGGFSYGKTMPSMRIVRDEEIRKEPAGPAEMEMQ
jgi:hypothetical protein